MTAELRDRLDDLADAIADRDRDRANAELNAVVDLYDDLRQTQTQQVRRASLARSEPDLDEEDRTMLADFVRTASDLQMQRSSFMLAAFTVLRDDNLDDPDDLRAELNDPLDDLKEAEIDFTDQQERVAPVVEETTMPADVQLLSAHVRDQRVFAEEPFVGELVVGNVGDQTASDVVIEVDNSDGLDHDIEQDTIGSLAAGEDASQRYDFTAGDEGSEWISFKVQSEDGGLDRKRLDITVKAKPVVEWLPPLDDADHTINNRQTLPIKFELHDAHSGLIEEEQSVYLAVYGPEEGGESGELVDRWNLGEGRDALRFDADEGEYIATFHAREYELEDAEIYTSVVHDVRTNLEFGEASFEIDVRGGPGEGRGP